MNIASSHLGNQIAHLGNHMFEKKSLPTSRNIKYKYGKCFG